MRMGPSGYLRMISTQQASGIMLWLILDLET